MTAELVTLDIDDRGVATITLNRPEQLNAINMAMRDLLWEYLAAVEGIGDAKVIVFRGEGRAFSAGADISEFGTAPSVMASREARHERDVWWALLNHRCVTIARMHGYCFGAGLELPLCCDMRVASEGATFALPEVTLGYIPSAGATQTLPRLVPPGIAAGMILSGEPVASSDAVRFGLIDEVTAGAGLDEAVERAVQRALVEPDRVTARRRRALAAGATALAV